MTIETCADIHRKLWNRSQLDIGQGYGDSPRDRALLTELAGRLNVPNESFILSDESKNISAQQYLMAMLEILEPLSAMFNDIWLYCERAFARTSKNGLDISWNFNIHGESVDINFEAFRKYRKLLAKVPVKAEFNTLCNKFAEACARYRIGRDCGGGDSPMPPKPHNASPTGVASRIHELCTTIQELNLRKDGYWGIVDAIPALSAIEDHSWLWRENAFSDLKSMLNACTQTLEPDDIITLPFWKYRWQIYELWCLITTVQLFERRGFDLVRSTDGASLLDLRKNVLIAERKIEPTGQVFYQPSYLKNDAGERVHPDIVIVRGKPSNIQPSNVAAIIECKQHKMPKEEPWRTLKERYFDSVAVYYGNAMAANGKLVLVNYDKIDFQPTYTLIEEFTPTNRKSLEVSLASILDEFSVQEQSRQAVLIVDGSTSMASLLSKLQGKVKELHAKQGAFDDVICLLDNGPCILKHQDIANLVLSGSESAALFIDGLHLAQSAYPLTVAHVLTDLEPDCEIFSEVRQACSDIIFQVHCIS